ncbi:hypothetical protein [Subdoligranulum variabile]|uniref:hypothetical protein n=1 Tax=Subdoligranulum variabile TaxID=214851 RepID=UPI0026E9395F|nr:hypothetical protein [Subdoligranulum variabile]
MPTIAAKNVGTVIQNVGFCGFMITSPPFSVNRKQQTPRKIIETPKRPVSFRQNSRKNVGKCGFRLFSGPAGGFSYTFLEVLLKKQPSFLGHATKTCGVFSHNTKIDSGLTGVQHTGTGGIFPLFYRQTPSCFPSAQRV